MKKQALQSKTCLLLWTCSTCHHDCGCGVCISGFLQSWQTVTHSKDQTPTLAFDTDQINWTTFSAPFCCCFLLCMVQVRNDLPLWFCNFPKITTKNNFVTTHGSVRNGNVTHVDTYTWHVRAAMATILTSLGMTRLGIESTTNQSQDGHSPPEPLSWCCPSSRLDAADKCYHHPELTLQLPLRPRPSWKPAGSITGHYALSQFHLKYKYGLTILIPLI